MYQIYTTPAFISPYSPNRPCCADPKELQHAKQTDVNDEETDEGIVKHLHPFLLVRGELG